jgi:S1-C subfamily serine protease
MKELTVRVAFLILIIISSFSFTIFGSDGLAQEKQVEQSTPGSDTNAFLSLNEIFNNVENSVVQITTSVPPVNILNPSQSENSTALGSGFIYDNKGHVVTNNHVVANAKIVDVTFIDGSRFTANVTGRDFYSDLAVLNCLLLWH